MSIKRLYPITRPTIDLNFAQSKRLSSQVTFTRTSSASRVNEVGDIEVVAAGLPRFEHDFTSLESLGLLIEETATNFVTHSVMTVPSGGGLPSGWVLDQTQSGVTIATVGSGIERGLAYVDIQVSGTSLNTNRSLIRPGGTIAVTSGQSYEMSAYTRLVSGTIPANVQCQFQMSNAAAGLTGIDNTLRRYSSGQGATETSAFTGFPRFDIGPMATGITCNFTIRIAGPQVVRSSDSPPVNFIPTSGATATKPADVATIDIASLGAGYNFSGGTFLYEGFTRQFFSSRALTFDNATTNQLIFLYTHSALTVSGPSQTNAAFGTNPTVVPSGFYKIATRLVPGTSAPFCVNGAAAVVNTGGVADPTLFSGVTVLKITPADVSGNNGGGVSRRIVYWPSGLSNATLQAITV